MTSPNQTTSPAQRRQQESFDRTALAEYQLARFNKLLGTILPANSFYANKLASCPSQLASLDQLGELPFTAKDELLTAGAVHHLPANLFLTTNLLFLNIDILLNLGDMHR